MANLLCPVCIMSIECYATVTLRCTLDWTRLVSSVSQHVYYVRVILGEFFSLQSP